MRRTLAVLGGGLATGVMLHGALPPIGWWPLGWIAFVPLLVAVYQTRFLVGFLGGLLSVGVTAWLGIVGLGYAHRSSEGSTAWVVVGCALFGFALAIVAGIAAEPKTTPPWRLAATAVLLEACLLLYLPASIAITQARVPAVLALASLAGIWAVAYAVWFTNLWLARQVLDGRKVHVAVGVVALPLVIGLAGQVWSSASGETRSIVLVQTEATDLSTLRQLTGTDPTTLAVWPEFGGLEAAPGGDAKDLRSLSASRGAFVTSFQDGHRPLPHNVAVLFAEGQESTPYRKRKLFGGETSMHTPGNLPVVAKWGSTRVGINICFDSCYPSIMRETAAMGADLIALPTIDPPSPNHWIAAMHAAYTPLRAAELGTPIARADGYAYSMVVDGKGRVVLELPPGRASAVTEVPVASGSTVYRATGDWALFVCGLSLVASALGSFRRRKVAAGRREEAFKESALTELRLRDSARTPPAPPSPD
ncbi:MAG: nitrilase-related carbon-nitrogen hydrolase [Fimbriimonas sp.]